MAITVTMPPDALSFAERHLAMLRASNPQGKAARRVVAQQIAAYERAHAAEMERTRQRVARQVDAMLARRQAKQEEGGAECP